MSDESLKGILESLADSFTEERKKQEPYKEMFKSGSSYTGIFRELEADMVGPVLDACSVIRERLGGDINNAQYNMLLALPLILHVAEQNAERNEGSPCCVDKAYFLVSEEFKKLGEIVQTSTPRLHGNDWRVYKFMVGARQRVRPPLDYPRGRSTRRNGLALTTI